MDDFLSSASLMDPPYCRITRIGAGCKEHAVSRTTASHDREFSFLLSMQMNYSRFIYGMNQQNIMLNRKVLSELALNEPYSFRALVDQVKWMRGGEQLKSK